MKWTSRFSLLLAAGLMFAAACWARAEPVFHVVTAAYRAVKDWVLDGFKLAAAKVEDTKPAVWFVQAKAFVLRLAKRQRPELTGGWRMCPST